MNRGFLFRNGYINLDENPITKAPYAKPAK
jgi:hypothetical protein